MFKIDLVFHTPHFCLLFLTVGALRAFVKSHLADPEISFYLCKFRFVFYEYMAVVLLKGVHY